MWQKSRTADGMWIVEVVLGRLICGLLLFATVVCICARGMNAVEDYAHVHDGFSILGGAQRPFFHHALTVHAHLLKLFEHMGQMQIKRPRAPMTALVRLDLYE